MLEPRRVVVILDAGHRRGEAERAGQLDLVLGLVRAVAAAALTFEKLHRGQRRFARQLGHIVHDAVLVKELGILEFAAAHLIFEHELDVAVDDRLTLERVEVVVHRDIDVGKNLKVGLPANSRAGFLRVCRLFREAFLGSGLVYALFEVQTVLEAVAHDGDVHVFGGILRRAGAEAVQTERELIVFAGVVFVFAAGVQLAEHELPVIALLLFVPFDRNAAAVVGDFDRTVRIAGGDDFGAEALARLVDRVGENFEHRVLAALQTVRTENNARALAHTVGALEGGYAFVAVRRLCFAHILLNPCISEVLKSINSCRETTVSPANCYLLYAVFALFATFILFMPRKRRKTGERYTVMPQCPRIHYSTNVRVFKAKK